MARKEFSGQASVRRERSRRRDRRDSRTHRIIEMQPGDEFEYRGLRIKAVSGTKLKLDVLTPQQYRHVFAAKRETGEERS